MASLDVFGDVKTQDANVSNNNNRQVRARHPASSVVSDDVMSLVSTDDNSVAMDTERLDASLEVTSQASGDVCSVCECDDVSASQTCERLRHQDADSRGANDARLSTSDEQQTDADEPQLSLFPANNDLHSIHDVSASDMSVLLALERQSTDVTLADDNDNARSLVTQRKWGDVEQERQLEERLLQLGLLRNKLFLEHCLRQQLQRNIDADDLFSAVNRCKRQRDVRARVDSCRREVVSAVQPRITRDSRGRNVTYSVGVLMGVFTHCVKHKVCHQTVTIQGQAPSIGTRTCSRRSTYRSRLPLT